MTESPCGGSYTPEQVDIMLHTIENDWKESGGYNYKWIIEVYSEMIRRNSKQK